MRAVIRAAANIFGFGARGVGAGAVRATSSTATGARDFGIDIRDRYETEAAAKDYAETVTSIVERFDGIIGGIKEKVADEEMAAEMEKDLRRIMIGQISVAFAKVEEMQKEGKFKLEAGALEYGARVSEILERFDGIIEDINKKVVDPEEAKEIEKNLRQIMVSQMQVAESKIRERRGIPSISPEAEETKSLVGGRENEYDGGRV